MKKIAIKMDKKFYKKVAAQIIIRNNTLKQINKKYFIIDIIAIIATILFFLSSYGSNNSSATLLTMISLILSIFCPIYSHKQYKKYGAKAEKKLGKEFKKYMKKHPDRKKTIERF